jgi:hypothetical protein
LSCCHAVGELVPADERCKLCAGQSSSQMKHSKHCECICAYGGLPHLSLA